MDALQLNDLEQGSAHNVCLSGKLCCASIILKDQTLRNYYRYYIIPVPVHSWMNFTFFNLGTIKHGRVFKPFLSYLHIMFVFLLRH